jgi:nicotinamidase-related amidase
MLATENTILLVIDMQGKLAHMMHEKETLFQNVRKMIQGAQIMNIPVIWIEQYPQGLGPTIPEVAELLTGLKPVAKITFNSCSNQEFMQVLTQLGRKQLLITGMETHVCVYQTVMGLLNLDYEVHIVADAVSSRTEQNKKIGIEKMKDGGAQVTSTETALFELMKIAEGEIFKEVLKVVK